MANKCEKQECYCVIISKLKHQCTLSRSLSHCHTENTYTTVMVTVSVKWLVKFFTLLPASISAMSDSKKVAVNYWDPELDVHTTEAPQLFQFCGTRDTLSTEQWETHISFMAKNLLYKINYTPADVPAWQHGMHLKKCCCSLVSVGATGK